MKRPDAGKLARTASRVLAVLIGLGPRAHRLVRAATILAQTALGWLSKSTTLHRFQPVSRWQKWDSDSEISWLENASGRFELRLRSSALWLKPSRPPNEVTG
jgi:hypothetical protein